MNPPFHRRLQQQIRDHLGGRVPPGPEFQAFLDAVVAAGRESDAECARLAQELERASRERRDTQAYMQAVFHAFPDLFVWIDEHDVFTDCQGGGAPDLYFGLHRPVGRSLADIPLPSLREAFAHAVRKVRETRRNTSLEYRLPSLYGGLSCETRLLPLPDQTLIAIFRDISERKQAELALRESEARFKQVAENAGEWIWELDADGVYTYSNPVVERILGYTPAELIGQIRFYDLFPPGLREEIKKAADARADRKEGFHRITNPVLRKDGRVVILETTGVPILDPEGRLAGYRGTDSDVTERNKAEKALRESEARNRALLRAIPDIMFIYDHDAVFLDCRAPDPSLLAMPPDQFIGKRMHEILPAQVADPTLQCIRRARETKQTQRLEYTLDIGGNTLHFEARISPLDDHRFLSIVRDITDQKLAEQEREQLQTQLTHAHKMESIGRLAGGVAHDFNNMLGAILGHAELAMEDTPDGHPLREHLVEIRKAGQRSADLTRQLLAFARKQTVRPRRINLNETVEGMLKMIRRLIGEQIDLVWRPGPDAGSVLIDPSQLDQILANLCVNARDAIAGSGTITIETGPADLDEPFCDAHAGIRPGPYVRLAVRDSGAGMDATTLAHIFEPFFTTKDIGEGTGLGLSTVYGAVQQNNGCVTVQSRPEHGTLFEVFLPRHPDPADAPPPEEPPAPPPPHRKTILLVEDEPAILTISAGLLRHLGYTVLTAASPDQALHLAQSHPGEIHLLMTDVVMPGMNGRELARQLLASRPRLKRLYMSGYTADVIAHHGILDPGVHFIQKPFSKKDLAACLHEAFAGA
ncbi:MAG: PAS domain-containing protein [Lentisphaerae bacterium]|nr:PAS domain-containing protein [Lentisphaerota bacterium]